MSFWGSLFGGSNPTLNSTIGQTGQIAGFTNSLGQKNTTQGSNFFSSLLSGDATKTAQALAPQISAAKKSAQQDQKTSAIFGTRSGGTAAANAASKDKVHSDITNLTGSLTGGAASSLLSSGEGLLGTSLGALNQQAGMSREQMQNWANSILGKGVSGAVGAAESFGLGKLGGGGGGAPSASGPSTGIGSSLASIGGSGDPLATTASDESNMWLT